MQDGEPDDSAGAGRLDDDGPSQLRLRAALSEAELVVRSRAREIARALAIPRPRTARPTGRGGRERRSLPYRDGADELDLDRSLEVLVGNPAPQDEDLIVRDRTQEPRSVVLLVDVSGSMRGERILTAAATVGALASELEQDHLSIIAFWSDAVQLLRFDQRVDPDQILDMMLRIPSRGLTNIEYPLALAAKQLAAARGRERRVLLLSDCVHVAGPDPRPRAARLPRLDVLVDAAGVRDVELGRDLAHAGHGELRVVTTHRDVAPALADIFRN